MKENEKSEPFDEENVAEETQDQPLDPDLKTPEVITSKKRWPKRGGCGGSLAGDPGTPLAGDTTTVPLTGDAGTGIEEGDDSEYMKVVRSTQDIRRGATIAREDVTQYSITSVVYNPGMLQRLNQAVGRVAQRKINKGTILYNYMVR